MDCLVSTPTNPGRAARRSRSEAVDAEAGKYRQAERKVVKMLLLGSGESGKSTVLKQIQIMHHGPYTETERKALKDVIFSNTITSMKVVQTAMDSLVISIGSLEAHMASELVAHAPDQFGTPDLPATLVQAIATPWKEEGVQEAFSRSYEYQLNDSARYYFDAIQRMGTPGYIPTVQDVLRTRVTTTGIIEEKFEMDDGTVYYLTDVGGQRSERRKWIHCFEGVNAILFLAALSEYDQGLYENDTVNRMQEALMLFESICNSRWFSKSTMILILNKTDLLQAKLPVSPLQNYFADYTPIPEADLKPMDEYKHAAAYLSNKFTSLSRNPSQTVYHHLTCATDTHQMSFVMKAVRNTVTRTNLETACML